MPFTLRKQSSNLSWLQGVMEHTDGSDLSVDGDGRSQHLVLLAPRNAVNARLMRAGPCGTLEEGLECRLLLVISRVSICLRHVHEDVHGTPQSRGSDTRVVERLGGISYNCTISGIFH